MSAEEPPTTTGAIALWSAPRSRSTAFLRMMMQRPGVVTLHEPFSHLADFGSTEVDGTAVRSEAELIAAILRLSRERLVFFKDTTDFHYPGVLADPRFLTEVRHTFIIRRPDEVIASHYALNPALTEPEIGFGRLRELFDAVAAETGSVPAVVDSDALLDDPEGTVRAYCERAGLDHRPQDLSWRAGAHDSWGRAQRWHVDAERSTGFVRSERSYPHTVANTPLLADYHRAQLPHYEALHRHRLVPAGAPRP
ncbi:sulfotransferase family protein [Kitasatospora sp. NPDC085895]|uniref:sulfotransferase-like domain-containing protein n=1 Tax=Kitasatospora sp. NPDC085895 TaxID=3155057 RepID=UPI00344DB310